MSKQVAASAASCKHLLEERCATSDNEPGLCYEFAESRHTCFHVFRARPVVSSAVDLPQAEDLFTPDRVLDPASRASVGAQHVVTPPSSDQSMLDGDNDASWPIPSNGCTGPEERVQMDRVSSRAFYDNELQSIPSSERIPVPADAEFLITYYRDNMGNWFSPLHSSKHPWAVLHLPVALTTLSELTLWGETKHARAAIFHSLLSLSAFTLAPDDDSGYWRTVASQCRAVARERMKESLASEFDGPSKAKYKDMLLAFLTLISISVCLKDKPCLGVVD